MKIIIEGPDGSGKSTLVSTLSEMFKYKTHHIGKPITQEDFNNEYQNFLNVLKEDNIIIDRISVISENIYSKIFNRASRIKFDLNLEVLKDHDWKLIFCITDDINILKGKKYKSNEWYNNVETNIEKIKLEYINTYKILKEKFPEKIMIYNYKIDKLDSVLNFIK